MLADVSSETHRSACSGAGALGAQTKTPGHGPGDPVCAEGLHRARPPAREGSGSRGSWCPVPFSDPTGRRGPHGAHTLYASSWGSRSTGGAGSQAGRRCEEWQGPFLAAPHTSLSTQMIVSPSGTGSQGTFSLRRGVDRVPRSVADCHAGGAKPIGPGGPLARTIGHERAARSGAGRCGDGPAQARGDGSRFWIAASSVPTTATAVSTT